MLPGFAAFLVLSLTDLPGVCFLDEGLAKLARSSLLDWSSLLGSNSSLLGWSSSLLDWSLLLLASDVSMPGFAAFSAGASANLIVFLIYLVGSVGSPASGWSTSSVLGLVAHYRLVRFRLILLISFGLVVRARLDILI